MNPVWIAFIAGLFLGCFFGVLGMAIVQNGMNERRVYYFDDGDDKNENVPGN